MRIINDFEKKTKTKIIKESITLYSGNVIPVYTITTANDLIQYVGYGKYINYLNTNVFIRGQVDLYNGMLVPSLFRGKKNLNSAVSKFYERINSILSSEKSFSRFPKSVFEATIQHYGIKTTQIDLVDNLWVALWFASNEFYGRIIDTNEHVFISPSKREYGYILLVACDALTPSTSVKGLYEGGQTQVIDLRKALPSYYLRPHSQHAYMMKGKNSLKYDYSDCIIGIAKIPICEIRKWIGCSELLSTSTLFPSAYFDSGYEVLLKNFPKWDSSIVRYQGSIQIISD